MWLTFAFISATLLGMYEVFKKMALEGNAVIPVLFLNTVFCSLLFLPVILLSRFCPEMMQDTLVYVPKVSFETHLFIILKAVIVLASWIFAYYAMKHLPITIAATIESIPAGSYIVGRFIGFWRTVEFVSVDRGYDRHHLFLYVVVCREKRRNQLCS